MSTRAALLEVLRADGPGYGLELITRVKQRTSYAVELGQGSVYPTLDAFVAEGLAVTWESPSLPVRGGRPRRYYELTKAGRKLAEEQRRAVLGLFSDTGMSGTSVAD